MRGNSSAAGELERALARFVAENRMPGAAAAVVRGGEVAWSGQIGFADVAAKRPAGPATLYRIASITKTFTGTAVMQLRDAGRLALDRTRRHLPSRAAQRGEPVRADRGCHDPPDALSRIRPRGRAARHRLVRFALPGLARNHPRERGRPRRQGGAGIAAQVLRPGLPAARRDRHQGQRHSVPAVYRGARSSTRSRCRPPASSRSPGRCRTGARPVTTGPD